MQSNDSKEDEPSNFYRIFNLKNVYKNKGNTIEKMIEKAKDGGFISTVQRDMMQKIVNLNQVTVSDIMTHRIDIKAVEKNENINNIFQIYAKIPYSKMPVYDIDIDKIVGIIFLNDLLKAKVNDEYKNKTAKFFMKKPVFVPETMKCDILFKQLVSKKTSLAIVVDEYGGTSGIVSLKDVYDLVFKELEKTNNDSSSKDMIQLKDNSLILNGNTDVKKVGDMLNILIDKDENTGTIGGFLVGVLGRIPEQNEKPTIKYKNVEFKVLAVDRQQISKIKAMRVKNSV